MFRRENPFGHGWPSRVFSRLNDQLTSASDIKVDENETPGKWNERVGEPTTPWSATTCERTWPFFWPKHGQPIKTRKRVVSAAGFSAGGSGSVGVYHVPTVLLRAFVNSAIFIIRLEARFTS